MQKDVKRLFEQLKNYEDQKANRQNEIKKVNEEIEDLRRKQAETVSQADPDEFVKIDTQINYLKSRLSYLNQPIKADIMSEAEAGKIMHEVQKQSIATFETEALQLLKKIDVLYEQSRAEHAELQDIQAYYMRCTGKNCNLFEPFGTLKMSGAFEPFIRIVKSRYNLK